MEAAPQHFNQLEEETIRFIYLASLNAVFEIEGHGEAFRGKGKTDILLALPEFENAIIIELKKWDGPKHHTETFLQTKGYRTWRDNDLIIVVIVNNKNMSQVVKSATDIISGRADLIGEIKQLNSSSFISNHIIDGENVRVSQIFFHLPL